MKAWRLSRFASQERTFDGEGARQYPGRWNSAGMPVVYASEHLSLAVLEVLVHVRVDQVRVGFHAFEITIPDSLVEVVADERLPRAWDAVAIGRGTCELGDAWARERRSVALSVPSIVVPHERNVVLNPVHPEFAQLQIARAVRFRQLLDRLRSTAAHGEVRAECVPQDVEVARRLEPCDPLGALHPAPKHLPTRRPAALPSRTRTGGSQPTWARMLMAMWPLSG